MLNQSKNVPPCAGAGAFCISLLLPTVCCPQPPFRLVTTRTRDPRKIPKDSAAAPRQNKTPHHHTPHTPPHKQQHTLTHTL